MPAVRGVLRRRCEEAPRIKRKFVFYLFSARGRSFLTRPVRSPPHRAPGFIPCHPVERVRLCLPRGLLEDEVQLSPSRWRGTQEVDPELPVLTRPHSTMIVSNRTSLLFSKLFT